MSNPSYTVGLQTLALIDPTRRNWQNTAPRPLTTDIWYPAESNAVETEIYLGAPDAPLFIAGRAARNAPPLTAPNLFPLILLSHGTGGTAMQLGWLAAALAAQGNIVAGLNHHGNTALERYTVEGFSHVWERARDVSAVLTQLITHPVFGPRIDPQRIGAAGFSLGGYTVLALAGGEIDLPQFLDAYAAAGRNLQDDLPPEFSDAAKLYAHFLRLAETDTSHKQSFRDDRIRAVFALAPVLGQAFTQHSLSRIQTPVFIVVGASDDQAIPELNARLIAQSIPYCELSILPAPTTHYVFLADCTDLGRQNLSLLCVDPPPLDRAATHAQVSHMAATFFHQRLISSHPL